MLHLHEVQTVLAVDMLYTHERRKPAEAAVLNMKNGAKKRYVG